MAKFDPTQFGATPATQDSNKFDPTQFGASAVSQPPATSNEPSFLQKAKQEAVDVSNQFKQKFNERSASINPDFSSPWAATGTILRGIFNVPGVIKDAALTAGGEFIKGVSNIPAPLPRYEGDTVGSNFSDVTKAAGTAIGDLPTMSGGTVKQSFQDNIAKPVEGVAIKGIKLWEETKKEYPNLAPTLETMAGGALDAIDVLLAGEGTEFVKNVLVKAAESGTEITKPLIEATAIKLKKAGNAVVDNIAQRRAAKQAEQIDQIVGKITQGNKQEISKAKEALKVIDTTDVKSYSDLSQRTNDTIGAFAKKQDDLLSVYGKLVKPEELKPIVKDGIEQLKELYSKTNNPESLARINQLEAKAKSEGLTTKEINQLARDYASDMPKAFTKTGEPMTSINKLASENTRKQLKQAARELLPNDASKLLDENMTNLYTLRDTSSRMDAAVQKLENKIKKRGLLEKLGRGVGKGIDVATGGSIRGLLTSFLPSNIGNKVLNSVDLEAILEKNLAKLDKLSTSGTDEDILNYVDALIKAKPPTQ